MTRYHDRFWTSPRGLAALVLIAVASYFLLAEHRAHVMTALPWLVLLLCPLMHLLMHRGHGHGHRDDRPEDCDRGATTKDDDPGDPNSGPAGR